MGVLKYGDKFKLTGLPPRLSGIKLADHKMEHYGLLRLSNEEDISVLDVMVLPTLQQLKDFSSKHPTGASPATWVPAIHNDTCKDVLETEVGLITPVQVKLSKVVSACPQIHPHVEKSLEKTVACIPPSIKFTNYAPHKTYRQTLLVKNKMSHSQRFQVTTTIPKGTLSPFFEIKMVGAPNNKEGFVAPGMSCKYHVFFRPDTYADYHHKLLVKSEFGRDFTVELDAERAGPILDLPPVLDCGIARVGVAELARFTVTNRGGDGRFFVIDDEGSSVEPECYDVFRDSGEFTMRTGTIGPFEIYPFYFALKTGESVDVTVKYESRTAGEDIARLQIACNNHLIYEYEMVGRAEVPCVSVLENDTDDTALVIGDGLYTLEFGDQNPECSTMRTLVIRNNNNLTLSYDWTTTLDNSRGFNITPNHGSFPAKQSETFYIEFKPSQARQYEAYAEFSIQAPDDAKSVDTPVEFQTAYASQQMKTTLVRICMKGTGRHPNVYHSPPYISIDSIYVGVEHTAFVRLTSACVSPMTVDMKVVGVDTSVASVAFESESIVIQPGGRLDIPVKVTGMFPGIVDGEIVCVVSGNDAYTFSVPVHFGVELDPAEVKFGVPILDFGVIALGQHKSIKIPLVNSSRLEVYPLSYF